MCSEAPDIQEEAFTEGCGGAIYLTCCIFGSVIPCSMLLCRFSFFFFSIDVRGIFGWFRSNGVKSAQVTGGLLSGVGMRRSIFTASRFSGCASTAVVSITVNSQTANCALCA